MAKLNQILAIEKGRKSESNSIITKAYHLIQKPDLFKGLTRTYTPKDEEGDQLPEEVSNVAETVSNLIKVVREAFVEYIDIVATKDWANTTAKANVVVDDNIILEDVPVTFLLALEKQLVDFHTFVSKLPTLEITDVWTLDEGQGLFRTAPTETNRTKKVMRNHVKAEATEHHPAQVETYTEDVIVGKWSATKFSGAIEPAEQQRLLERITVLRDAVKFAREEANETTVTDIEIGDKVFDFILS